MEIKPPTLPMYPTPRDWERMQNEIRAQAANVADYFAKAAEVVGDNALDKSNVYSKDHIKALVEEALADIVSDICGSITDQIVAESENA